MEICWEGKQMCQYPTHIFSVKLYLFIHLAGLYGWLLGHTWYVAWCFQTMCAPALKSRSGVRCRDPMRNRQLQLQIAFAHFFDCSIYRADPGSDWLLVSNAIFVIFNHSSMGGWFPMVRIFLRVFLSLDIIGVLQSCGSVVWPERLVKISLSRREDIDGPCGDLTAVPLPFRGPKEEPASCSELALASMRIHRTCDFFMDASYELSPATGHTCCVIERIPFFWWIGACFIAMIDSRWITARLKENVESIPWIDEFRES